MEIVGGFMVMMSIIGFFLAVVWLVMPFVVFTIKGKQDRTLEVLEAMEKRLAAIETRLQPVVQSRSSTEAECCTGSVDIQESHSTNNSVVHPDPAAGKCGEEVTPAG
ncbi:MAG: hypothetical protein PHY09_04525 [Desulfuromonadaceae bacterium]|nr:hypothetical protein [Desulfuromonadaceae bacterium]MDD5104624.1 hypothetical protein [Desulfuromonadaceae bacterium]